MSAELAALRREVAELRELVEHLVALLAPPEEPDGGALEALHARFKSRLKGGR